MSGHIPPVVDSEAACPGCRRAAQTWPVPSVFSACATDSTDGEPGRDTPFRTTAAPAEAQSLPVRLDPRPVIKEHRAAAVLGLVVLLIGEAVALFLLFGDLDAVAARARATAGGGAGLGDVLHVIWITGTPAVIAALVAFPYFRSAYWRKRIARGFELSYPVWESARYCAQCDAVWIPSTPASSGLPVRQLLSTAEFRLVLRQVGGFERIS